jgi:hypothetical protein
MYLDTKNYTSIINIETDPKLHTRKYKDTYADIVQNCTLYKVSGHCTVYTVPSYQNELNECIFTWC